MRGPADGWAASARRAVGAAYSGLGGGGGLLLGLFSAREVVAAGETQ